MVLGFFFLFFFFRSGTALHNLWFPSSLLSSAFLLLIGLLVLWCSFYPHSQSTVGTFHTQWSWKSWACVACYLSGHSQDPLRCFQPGSSRQTCRFLATGSSYVSWLLGIVFAASPGGLGHCSVFPGLNPPQPLCVQPEAGCIALQLPDTSLWIWGFSPPFLFQIFFKICAWSIHEFRTQHDLGDVSSWWEMWQWEWELAGFANPRQCRFCCLLSSPKRFSPLTGVDAECCKEPYKRLTSESSASCYDW